MNLEIIKQKELPLLSRKRVSLWYKEPGSTPTRKDIINEISKMFKIKPELVIIKHIYSQFGDDKAKIIVHIYDDEKKMKFFEHKSLIKKHDFKEKPEAKKEEEKKVEEKKQENGKEKEEK
jgi:small subunit ribosomal protein S24e